MQTEPSSDAESDHVILASSRSGFHVMLTHLTNDHDLSCLIHLDYAIHSFPFLVLVQNGYLFLPIPSSKWGLGNFRQFLLSSRNATCWSIQKKNALQNEDKESHTMDGM